MPHVHDDSGVRRAHRGRFVIINCTIGTSPERFLSLYFVFAIHLLQNIINKMSSQQNSSALAAAFLFRVEGLVAVVTGGATGAYYHAKK